uniref:Uncharacterized protein n=1 Tax=Arundo donax TaxID=35708 RepID=A0A0A9FA12_ARUDO
MNRCPWKISGSLWTLSSSAEVHLLTNSSSGSVPSLAMTTCTA